MSTSAIVAALTIAAGVAALWAGWSHARPAGRIATIVLLAAVPFAATLLGTGAHLERSKSTEFCLSCHVMEPYGDSLRLDDAEAVPANHWQNRRVPRDHACYACHTSYTMFGDLESKWRGVRHVWVQYFGSDDAPVELYEPYRNRECLHCHEGARAFEENEFHAEMRGEIASGEASCLDCHEGGHRLEALETTPSWQPAVAGEAGGPAAEAP